MFYSNIQLYGEDYILVMNSLKSYNEWYLYSKIHPDDYINHLDGKELQHKVLNEGDLYKDKSLEYLVEAMKVTQYNKVYYCKNHVMLMNIITSMNSAKTYSYSKSEVLQSGNEVTPEGIISTYSAMSDNCSYRESKNGGKFVSLGFSYNDVTVEFIEVSGFKLPNIKSAESKSKRPADFEYEELREEDRKFVSRTINVKDIDFETLVDSMDLSWYYDSETGEFKKDYQDVRDTASFESKVITALVYAILDDVRKGLPPRLIGFDTETDGLDFYYYPGNENKLNNIASAQISWEFDKGYNIFLDMEYFDNCPRDYVMKRLADLFRWDRGKFIYKIYYDENGNKLERPQEVLLDRDWFLVGGHNIIFDSKVFRRHGYEIYFDEDTLQMAFSIAPTSFKVKKDLKALTTFFLGLSYPELKTLLGKGNEDKFRYLRDARVANLYGCADVDMFRKVWFALRNLMGDKIYKAYKRIDSYLLNVLSESEYYGLRIDKDLIKKRGEEIQRDLEILEEQIYSFVGKMRLLQFCQSIGETCTQEQFESAYYKFKITGKEILTVFYDYLKYPVTVLTKKKERALNSYAIDKLLYHKLDTPNEFLKKDILSSDGKRVLISKDKFNSFKYPLAYVLKEYKVLQKEYNGYYKPFFKEDTGDRLFRPIKAANIETRRISCATQTVKKDIKKCIIAHADDWNLGDWDLAQVESRVFTSLAGDTVMIERMKDPDRDTHTETASLVNGIPAHLVPKPVRSQAKAIGFGVPYGLSEYKLCERIFTEVTEENLLKTRILLSIFYEKNHISMDELQSYRMKAHDLVDVSDELLRFWGLEPGTPIAMIHNKNGFYRYQDMTKILDDPKKMASVERAFGNFPIQSFAADYYKLLLTRLHKRIRREGLQDRILFHMYIHDELLFSFHKSIDPKYIVKIIKEECMLRIKGHTNYYLGINFGANWNQCKKDEAELPVKFVQRLCANYDSYEKLDWCDDPAGYFKPMIYEFKIDRVFECMELYSDLNNGRVDLDNILENFENYTVRSYLGDLKDSFTPSVALDKETGNIKIGKNGEFASDADDESKSRLCYAIVNRATNLEDLVFIYDEQEYSWADLVAKKDEERQVVSATYQESVMLGDEEFDIDLDEDIEEFIADEEDRFYSFDDSESYYDDFIFVDNDVDLESKKVINLAELLRKEQSDSFKYVETLGKTKILKLKNYSSLDKLTYMIQNSLHDKSATVKYRIKIEIESVVKVLPMEYSLVSDDKLEKALIELNEGGETKAM